MANVTLLPVLGTRASLAIDGPANATWNTIVEANNDYMGGAGNAITIAATDDGSGTGSVTVSGTAVTIHFANAVTTAANIEAAIAASAAASALIRVKTACTTPTYALLTAGDTFSATHLTAGGATSSAAPSIASATAGVALGVACDEAHLLLRDVDSVTGTTKTAAGTLWGFHPAMNQWFPLGAINNGSNVVEVISDRLTYVELIRGLRGFTRAYFQIASLGGAGTEIEVILACTPCDSTTA